MLRVHERHKVTQQDSMTEWRSEAESPRPQSDNSNHYAALALF